MKSEIIGEVVPDRWLALTLYAPLRPVAASNYLRYGPDGVRHYGPQASEKLPHPHSIKVDVTAKQAGGKILFEQAGVLLVDQNPGAPFDLEGTVVWMGSLPGANVTVTWVWDFYRMYSGLRIQLDLGDPGTVQELWTRTQEALKSLAPGDQMIVRSGSESGAILQVYPVDEAVREIIREEI